MDLTTKQQEQIDKLKVVLEVVSDTSMSENEYLKGFHNGVESVLAILEDRDAVLLEPDTLF